MEQYGLWRIDYGLFFYGLDYGQLLSRRIKPHKNVNFPNSYLDLTYFWLKSQSAFRMSQVILQKR